MILRSKPLRNDSKLEAAAMFDADAVMPGATGHHVRRIQAGLNEIEARFLPMDGFFGPRTAAAVLAYKRRCNIVDHRGQAASADAAENPADEFVDRRTILSLDEDLLDKMTRRHPVTQYLPNMLWQQGTTLRSK